LLVSHVLELPIHHQGLGFFEWLVVDKHFKFELTKSRGK
jgi:hypothetical protein